MPRFSERALKSVYFAHVRSYLEYGSDVWSPYYQLHSDRIESIQKKFLMYALRHTVRRDDNHRLPTYVDRCKSIGFESLLRRRLNLSALFVFDSLRGRVDAPTLASKLRRNESLRSLRNDSFWSLAGHRTNYGQFEPVNDMSRTFNLFAHFYDERLTRFQFRSSIRSAVLTNEMLRKNGFLLTLE